ncbi:MAG: hypothetical protein IJN04_04010 [Clostridia bacterium]|nr:hypothetical protein [Clostridia bacterium]
MRKVPISEYPQTKEWGDKVNSTPSVPGGKNVALSNLRKLLLAIQNGHPLDVVPQLEESNSKSTLNELCIHQLSPLNFVVRTETGGWCLSEAAQKWLATEDNDYLAALFCANVKFFAEILFYLDSPKTSRELFNIAINEYDLSWKNVSTINNRLVWLRQFGLIDFQEFSLLYTITEAGKAFLSVVTPVIPESLASEKDDTASEESVILPEECTDYFTNNKNASRKAGFGYLPGKTSELIETITSFIEQIKLDNRIESISAFAFEKYGIKDSSTRSALGTISSLGLIERKTNITYEVTDLGCCWMAEKDILFLLPLIQTRCLFFLEILLELENSSLSNKELATLAKISYGFDKENIPEISCRLSVLKEAKLIINVSAEKVTLTHRGRLFLKQFGSLFEIRTRQKETVATESSANVDIISELRLASKDGYNPDRFEKVVRDFFALIGFDAEWLGGAGKTDVLLKTVGAPVGSFIVTVDAKATSSSMVTDGLVDFDTLDEHRKKHCSDYIAIVGRDFNDRLVRRAIEHNVCLFDVDALEQLLLIHRKSPQKITVYRKLFQQSGRVDLSVLDADVSASEKARAITIGILEILIAECGDPITNGKLSVRDLYMSLRRNPDILPVPSIEEIENALAFLSSPIIGCVTREKEYYCAIASLGDLSRTLKFIQEKC